MNAQTQLAILLNDYFAKAERGGIKSDKAKELEQAIQAAIKERSVEFCQSALFNRRTAVTKTVLVKEYEATYPPRSGHKTD
jgi:hypothetical protein